MVYTGREYMTLAALADPAVIGFAGGVSSLDIGSATA